MTRAASFLLVAAAAAAGAAADRGAPTRRCGCPLRLAGGKPLGAIVQQSPTRTGSTMTYNMLTKAFPGCSVEKSHRKKGMERGRGPRRRGPSLFSRNVDRSMFHVCPRV